MKRLLNIVLILIALLVVAVFALPALIPADTYREPLRTALSEQLGRDADLAGDLSFSILPRVQISARDVRIANADGFGEDAFAEIADLRVAVGLLPLLGRRVEIDQFVLVDPVIRLEQRGTRNNWTFETGNADAQTATAAPAGEDFIRQPGALPFETVLGDVRITNGSIYYTNGTDSHAITGLDLSVRMENFDSPARLDGALNADGESIGFEAEIASIRALFEGAETPITLDLSGRLVQASFNGRIPQGEDFTLNGRVDLDIPDLRGLAAFAGSPMPEGDNLQSVSGSGQLAVAGTRFALTGARVRMDEIAANGDLAVNLGGARPVITGTLTVPELDVTPYLSSAPAEAAPSSEAGIPPWSDEPIDLAGLGVADADLSLSVGRFQFRDIVVNDPTLAVRLENSRLVTELTQFDLYGGRGSVRVIANARRARPSFSATMDVRDLNAEPFLIAAAGFEQLSGTGELRLDLTTSGNSQAAMMSALDGTGAFTFRDGAIKGINLASVVRNVQSFVSGPAANDQTSSETSGEEIGGVGADEATDFTELSATFQVTDGLARNSDLAMLSPLIRVTGSGWVNLPEQTLDYRLQPRAVASIQGQGGERDIQGITVPVRAHGSFNALSFGVDTQAVANALLNSVISNALGGDGSAPVRPEDALRDGLLDALGLNPPTDPQPADTTDGEQPTEEVDPAEALLRGFLGQALGGDDEDDGGN